MKTIKRIIFLDKIEDLDLNNIGVHFTADLNYNHNGGGSNGLTKTDAQYKVVVYVKKYVVNEEATKISNDNYPCEKEIVLQMNQVISAELLVFQKNDTMQFGRATNMGKVKCNVGTRADIWVLETIN